MTVLDIIPPECLSVVDSLWIALDRIVLRCDPISHVSCHVIIFLVLLLGDLVLGDLVLGPIQAFRE